MIHFLLGFSASGLEVLVFWECSLNFSVVKLPSLLGMGAEFEFFYCHTLETNVTMGNQNMFETKHNYLVTTRCLGNHKCQER